jgi:hypothetical protein
LRINERFSIAGAAGILGLFVVLGLFGVVSLLGADPRTPLEGLGSEEEVVSPEGFDGPFQSGARALGESAAPSETPQESPAENESPEETAVPTPTPAAVLAAIAAREARPAATGGHAQPTPAAPAGNPTPATPPPTANPTPAPTAPPETPTPQPDVCSTGGTPSIRETGKHVRLEYATVLSLLGEVLLVDVSGTVTGLVTTPSTVVTGNLGAATLVQAEGHREGDGSVTAEVITVLCPDSAR